MSYWNWDSMIFFPDAQFVLAPSKDVCMSLYLTSRTHTGCPKTVFDVQNILDVQPLCMDVHLRFNGSLHFTQNPVSLQALRRRHSGYFFLLRGWFVVCIFWEVFQNPFFNIFVRFWGSAVKFGFCQMICHVFCLDVCFWGL